MYVEHNSESHLCNHCCSGKAISITYSECVFVGIVSSMQCVCTLCHLWPARFNSIFPCNLINSTIKKKVIELKMRVLTFSTTFI